MSMTKPDWKLSSLTLGGLSFQWAITTYFQVVLADLGLISDDFTVVADKACVEVEDDVDEEEDVHDGVEDKHGDIRWVARCPGQLVRT